MLIPRRLWERCANIWGNNRFGVEDNYIEGKKFSLSWLKVKYFVIHEFSPSPLPPGDLIICFSIGESFYFHYTFLLSVTQIVVSLELFTGKEART